MNKIALKEQKKKTTKKPPKTLKLQLDLPANSHICLFSSFFTSYQILKYQELLQHSDIEG